MIRQIEPDDRTRWTDLWRGYLTFYETELPDEIYAATWARLFDPGEPVFGALSLDADRRPVGLVHYLFHRTTWSTADSCYLQDLFVDPAARSGGHGKALIEHVADRARQAGATRLYWNTHETNTTARRLYDAVGVRSGFIQYRKPLG